MPDAVIHSVSTCDARFPLPPGAGTDSLHTNSEYSFAVTCLSGENGLRGTGIALTLGKGNKLVCEAIEMLAHPLTGTAIEELMADFGRVSRKLADDPSLRWLGPHKGVVHLALASITNACFDLWAKSRGKPLWKLLLDLAPDEVVRLLDLSYLDEVLSERDAVELLQGQLASRNTRMSILNTGYPGYDTSVGWIGYDDQKVRDLTRRAMDSGFKAFKLKVGSDDQDRDLRRAAMLRECIGDSGALMFDANQRWSLPVALRMSRELALYKPGALVVGIMDPYGNDAAIKAIADAKLAAFAMELLPRITRAQVMDVLSSQANLAGYQAVIDAAAPYGRALPMMMTAAGTVPAATPTAATAEFAATPITAAA